MAADPYLCTGGTHPGWKREELGGEYVPPEKGQDDERRPMTPDALGGGFTSFMSSAAATTFLSERGGGEGNRCTRCSDEKNVVSGRCCDVRLRLSECPLF